MYTDTNTCTHKNNVIKSNSLLVLINIKVEIVISSYVIKSSLKKLHMFIFSDCFFPLLCAKVLVCDDFIYFL